MARLPDEIVERIRREISVQRLAEARGVKLRRVGKNLMGLCPFHQEKTPSLSITPSVNKWHCLGCGRGGTAIDWVMHAEGVSTRHALTMLSRDLVPVSPASAGPPPKKTTVLKLPPLLQQTSDDQKLLETVVSYYHQTLKESPEAQQYLIKRGLQSAEMVEHFRLGYANRTLGYHMPASNRLAGATQRGRLQELGILRPRTGHEHFRGSLVVPVLNLDGEVMQMYGRKVRNDLHAGIPDHLYLPGPLRGVWNEQALIASKEIILCEALIDALTFWWAGYRNVTSIYGVNNFTDELRAALKQHGTRRIYLAYDRDDAGERAAQAHGDELMAMGIECFRVQFPKGQDANEYARMTQPAARALGVLLTSATWLGKGQRPAVRAIQPVVIAAPQIEEEPHTDVKKEIPSPASTKPAAKEKSISAPEQNIFPLAATRASAQHEEAEPRPMPMASPSEPVVKIDGGEISVTIGARVYRVLNLEECTSAGKMKVNVKVSGRNVRGELGYHGDTLDMENFRQRASFAKQTAYELATKEDVIHREVGQLWTCLYDLQRELIRKALHQDTPKEKTMTPEEEAAALELLRDPRLLDRVLADFDKCGVVGEETNKKVSYLAAVSRLLPKPLAIVTQSASAAGKSSLMDAVLDFMPREQWENYSAMTGQSLYYMGEKNLKHKILAITEQQGAERASYPLKLLQSEGKLKIASTGKDPVSGKHITHDYEVEGPVMIFFTTTAQEVDEELLNRCIVLTVNEDREQTRAIHQKQREAQTLEGLKARMRQNKILKLHHNAQRLLRSIPVVNEHLKNLDFPDQMTRTRRDHMKFITLISAIALLHQHQREIKSSTEEGETLEYIEATEDDVKLAWALTNQVVVRSLDDVPPQTRCLLLLLDTMVSQECARLMVERSDYRFTRATVRQFTQWGDSQLKKHLSRLEDLEYLALHRGLPGQSFVYALNFEMDEQGRPVLPGLSYGARRSRSEGHLSRFEAGVSRSSHGLVTGVSRYGHGEEPPATTRVESSFSNQQGKHSTRGNESHKGPSNPVIAVAQPNGHAAKRAGVK